MAIIRNLLGLLSPDSVMPDEKTKMTVLVITADKAYLIDEKGTGWLLETGEKRVFRPTKEDDFSHHATQGVVLSDEQKECSSATHAILHVFDIQIQREIASLKHSSDEKSGYSEGIQRESIALLTLREELLHHIESLMINENNEEVQQRITVLLKEMYAPSKESLHPKDVLFLDESSPFPLISELHMFFLLHMDWQLNAYYCVINKDASQEEKNAILQEFPRLTLVNNCSVLCPKGESDMYMYRSLYNGELSRLDTLKMTIPNSHGIEIVEHEFNTLEDMLLYIKEVSIFHALHQYKKDIRKYEEQTAPKDALDDELYERNKKLLDIDTQLMNAIILCRKSTDSEKRLEQKVLITELRKRSDELLAE